MRLFQFRCGLKLPDDDAGRDYVRLWVDHAAQLPDGRRRTEMFCEIWAPWMNDNDIANAYEAAVRCPRFWTGAELGEALNLAMYEREEKRITTIAPADVSEAKFTELRLEKKRERERARRRMKKKTPSIDRATERQKSLLAAVADIGGWVKVPLIVEKVQNEPCWRDPRGRSLPPKTLKRVVNRELRQLALNGALAERLEPTKWGPDARQVRSRPSATNGVTRNFVAGTPGQAHDEI